MSTVVLIRPGLTDYDEQSRVLGTLEMPMNEKGLEQVEGIVRHLQREDVQLEAIFASPFDPCCSTARAIAEAQKGIKVKELDELRNVDQGLWQGLPEAALRHLFDTVRWSSGDALADTVRNVPSTWRIGYAATLRDVDTAADLAAWLRRRA